MTASASTISSCATLKDVPRSLVYRILRTGEVRVNGGRAKPDLSPGQAGDRVRLPPAAGASASRTRRRHDAVEVAAGVRRGRGHLTRTAT